MRNRKPLYFALGILAAAAIACGGATEEFVIVTSELPTDEPPTPVPAEPTVDPNAGGGTDDKGTERGGLGSGSVDAMPTPNTDPQSINPGAGPSTLVGSYGVTGTNAGADTTYSGTATISGAGDFFFITWDIGESLTEGQGIFLNDTFSVAYPADVCSVSAYNVAADGSLDGLWVLEGEGTNPERATPTSGAPAVGLPSNYTVSGTNPDASTYEGSMTLTIGTDPNAYLFQQIFNDDTGTVQFDGAATLLSNVLGAAYSSTDDCGVIIYDVNADGTLTGIWTDTVVGINTNLGTEILTPGGGGATPLN